MPTAGGPNTLGESNLVFAYDTGDVSNSYKGAPTTNICTGADYSIYNDGATNARNQTSPLPPVAGYEVVKVTANTPGTYGQSILWTANYSSTPTTATNSVYAWLQSGNYVQVGQHWHPWNYGSPKYIEKGKWVRISETYAINEGASYGAAAMVYSTDGVAYFCMPQYELKPYQTPFVNFLNSRLATEGLLTLVGTNTIDLTNVSFDSSAKMVFDGTNDYVLIPTYTFGNGNWTVNMLVNANDFNNFNLMSNTSGGPVTNAFGAYSSKIFYYNYDGSWQSHSGNTTLSTSTWYMLTWVNYAGATANLGTMQMFVNGIADSSVFNSYTVNGGPCNAIGANWYSSFNGKIDAVQIYNKSLTAQEVRQNYQQYKTRFNLS